MVEGKKMKKKIIWMITMTMLFWSRPVNASGNVEIEFPYMTIDTLNIENRSSVIYEENDNETIASIYNEDNQLTERFTLYDHGNVLQIINDKFILDDFSKETIRWTTSISFQFENNQIGEVINKQMSVYGSDGLIKTESNRIYDDFIEQRINISLGTILVHEQKVSFRIGMDNNFINLFYRIGYTNYYRQPCENMFTIHLQ